MKFTNVLSDGTIPNKSGDNNPGFVNTDYPVFRYADALLMLAECQLNGVDCGGLEAYQQIRERAGLPTDKPLTRDGCAACPMWIWWPSTAIWSPSAA